MEMYPEFNTDTYFEAFPGRFIRKCGGGVLPTENRCTSLQLDHFDHDSIVSQNNGSFFRPTCERKLSVVVNPRCNLLKSLAHSHFNLLP